MGEEKGEKGKEGGHTDVFYKHYSIAGLLRVERKGEGGGGGGGGGAFGAHKSPCGPV